MGLAYAMIIEWEFKWNSLSFFTQTKEKGEIIFCLIIDF
jgi:hypothetical protein